MCPSPSELQRTTPTSIFCLGHSHVEAVEEAAKAGDIAIDAINFWNVPGGPLGQRDALGNPRFFDDIADRLQARVGPVFSFLGGNPPILIGTLRHPRPFDFVLPSEPDLPLDPEAELVPSLAVKALLEKAGRPWFGLMRELARLSDGPIYHMEPPPPGEGSEGMAVQTLWPLLPGMARVISPSLFRYKLWRLHSLVLREVCQPLGIEFVPVPKESQTEQGFLRPRYLGDGVHGSVEYGALILEQMGGFL